MSTVTNNKKRPRILRSFQFLGGERAYQLIYDFAIIIIFFLFFFAFIQITVPLYSEAEPVLNSLTTQSLETEGMSQKLREQLSGLDSPEIGKLLALLRVVTIGFFIGFPLLFAFFKYLIWCNQFSRRFAWKEYFGFLGLTYVGFIVMILLFSVFGMITQSNVIGFVIALFLIPATLYYFGSLYQSYFHRDIHFKDEGLDKWKKNHKPKKAKQKGFMEWVRNSSYQLLRIGKEFGIIQRYSLEYMISFSAFALPFLIKLVRAIVVYIGIGLIQYIPVGPLRQVLTFVLILCYIAWIRYYSYLITTERVWKNAS
jgi:hypothetical protein